MNILVTGGAGFIASQVAERYLQEGHQVTVLDNLASGFEANIPAQANWINKDLCDEDLIDIFKANSFDCVSHHAAHIDVRASVLNPRRDAEINILGTLNLLEAMRQTGTGQIIFASTGGAIYGEPIELPLTESSQARPLCPYAVSKWTCEHYIELYRRLYSLNYVILRYPNVYGPRQNPYGEAGVNAIFIGMMLAGKQPTIYGDGEQLRDYTFVEDIVEANNLALKHMDNQTYNIATGLGTSVNAIYSTLQQIIGFKTEAHYQPSRLGEIDKTYMSSQKIKNHWGWEPTVQLKEGLKQTVAWFETNGFERFESKQSLKDH